jgi:hypothetical protein
VQRVSGSPRGRPSFPSLLFPASFVPVPLGVCDCDCDCDCGILFVGFRSIFWLLVVVKVSQPSVPFHDSFVTQPICDMYFSFVSLVCSGPSASPHPHQGEQRAFCSPVLNSDSSAFGPALILGLGSAFVFFVCAAALSGSVLLHKVRSFWSVSRSIPDFRLFPKQEWWFSFFCLFFCLLPALQVHRLTPSRLEGEAVAPIFSLCPFSVFPKLEL